MPKQKILLSRCTFHVTTHPLKTGQKKYMAHPHIGTIHTTYKLIPQDMNFLCPVLGYWNTPQHRRIETKTPKRNTHCLDHKNTHTII